MPLTYTIDHARRRLTLTASGTLTGADAYAYLAATQACPRLSGYDQLLDLSGAQGVAGAQGWRLFQLAQAAATHDAPGHVARLAIVAPTDLLYGLARLYASYRSALAASTTQVGVFRTLAEAHAFLERRRA